MEWPAIIEKHRQALRDVVAGLVALAACLGGGPALPRHLQLTVLRLLRPAESAVRRLVILTALKLPMKPLPPPRLRKPKPPPAPRLKGIVVNLGLAMALPAPAAPPGPLKGGETSRPAFQLVDPLRRVMFDRRPVRTSVPRISVPGHTVPHPIVPRRRDDAVDGARLGRRLAALRFALDDLPAQARRFMRWEARNTRARAAGKIRRVGPLRWGQPPGQRRRRTHAVHDILAKLHDHTCYVLEGLDTS